MAAARILNDTSAPDYFIYERQDLANVSRDGVCGVKFVDGTLDYYTRSFANEQEAESEGYTVTHGEKCGICSELKILAAWLVHTDLTTPVRKCSAMNWIPGYMEECMRRLGFTDSCAKLWKDNARWTAKHCGAVCMKSWIFGEQYTSGNRTLNECLECDERNSGPILKAFSGRTRRNSGIITAINRTDNEMYYPKHKYFNFIRQ
mmetsp:Transcript_25864/g.22789  ORF Transcript_25864/g.22789 Transcript_25864/m.22789 type:complete len:204 (-) Transcript_25864:135-746(-)